MERLWSLAGAISGNRWQTRLRRKPQNQAKSVAMGCDPLPLNLDGKEGVDGSTVRGLCKSLVNRGFRVQIDLLLVECAVRMEPFMGLGPPSSATHPR
jgi:hypothetical protein